MFHLIIAFACLASLVQGAPQAYGVPMLDGRIVGGAPTTIEDYPYQVSLQLRSSHLCGGVVISEEYVVTAAHCTFETSAVNLTVRAGSTFHNSGGVVIQVAAVHQNPKFGKWTIDYDISVLELATPLTFGAAIAPVGLPEFNEPIVAGAISQVSGWGTLSEGSITAPTQLQVVDVPVVSFEECKRAYGMFLTERMMCAGLPEGGKDACQGDSGGPLVVNGTLIGLVSWGQGCANRGYPGVYANVPSLRDYITEITGF